MALPTAISGLEAPNGNNTGSLWGPYISSAGSIYVLGRRPAPNATTLRILKATDPTSSFSTALDITGFTSFLNGITVEADYANNKLHLLVSDGSAGSENRKYVEFTMDSDSALSTETVASGIDADGSSTAVIIWSGLRVRSNGDVVMAYHPTANHVMGGWYYTVWYRIRTGVNTFGTETEIDDGGQTSYLCNNVNIGASDLIYFYYGSGSGSGAGHAKTLTSGGTLSSAVNFYASVGSDYGVSMNFDNSGTIELIQFADGESPPHVHYNSSGGTINETTIGTTVRRTYACGNNGTDAWVLTQDSYLTDLRVRKSTDYGANWTDVAEAYPVTTRLNDFYSTGDLQGCRNQGSAVYTNGSGDIVFGFFVYDNNDSTYYYDEYVIAAGATQYPHTCNVSSPESISITKDTGGTSQECDCATGETVDLSNSPSKNSINDIAAPSSISLSNLPLTLLRPRIGQWLQGSAFGKIHQPPKYGPGGHFDHVVGGKKSAVNTSAFVTPNEVALTRSGETIQAATVLQAHAVSMARDIGKTISAYSASAFSVLRDISAAISVAYAEAVSLAQVQAGQQELVLASAETITLGSTAATSQAAVISQAQSVFGSVVASISFTYQGPGIAQGVTLLKSVARAVALSAGQAVSALRSAAKTIAAVFASTVTADTTYQPGTQQFDQTADIVSAESVSLLRSTSKIVSAAIGQVWALLTTKAAEWVVDIASASAISVARSTAKAIQTSMTQAMSLARTAATSAQIVLSQAQALTIAAMNAFLRTISFAQAQIVSVGRTADKMLGLASAALLSVQTASSRAISVAWAQAVSFASMASHIWNISFASAKSVTLAATFTLQQAASVASAQVVTAVGAAGKTIAVAWSSAVSLVKEASAIAWFTIRYRYWK